MNHSRRVLSEARLEESPVLVAPASLSALRPVTERERKLWRAAHEAGRAEGERAGYERGLAEGLKQAEAQLASAAAAVGKAAQALAAERRAAIQAAKAIALEVALAVARRIVRSEIERGAQVAAKAVEAALAEAGEAAVVRVRVNPDEKPQIERFLQATGVPELVADPAISPGGCVVETDCGSLDATVEAQWALAEAALREAAGEAGEREQ